jgi:hypothetical protein
MTDNSALERFNAINMSYRTPKRLAQVRRFKIKKQGGKSSKDKFFYQSRKYIAVRRLRIQGRFINREKAFEILGLKKGQIIDLADI